MLGIDLIEIDRIAAAAQKEHFVARIYTQSESEYAAGRPESLAGIFAAKEAAVKALGTGFNDISHREVEILHDINGAPYINFTGKAAEIVAGRKAHVSITHNRSSAAAVVILEEKV